VTQKLAQKLDQLLVANVALVRVMQITVNLIQDNMESGTMGGINGSAQVIQKRLNLPPVDVAAEGILKYRSQ
jgi:hypothetical protein